MSTAAIESTTTVSNQAECTPDLPEGVVHTRFGMVPATPDQQVQFKGGLPGFPGVECYQLERVPQIEGDLMLLQSVDHAEVAFFVLPIKSEDGVLNSSDIKTACGQLNIPESDLLMLTVVNLHRNGSRLEKYVNLRAPIFIDTQKQSGAQIVLANQDYPLRMQLGS